MNKKINNNLIIAIIWFLVAFVFFFRGEIWVGVPWLLVGVINLVWAVKVEKKNDKPKSISKGSVKTIELLNDVHEINDEYIGYGYIVDKAFKPAKSHAAEIELLCTYAPDDEYGSEGEFPCIAVQVDDEVYCAVEEYKERGTFDGAISIEPLEGRFLFRAKREYYGDLMYFYGFELEGEEYWDMAGLCVVYPNEYRGTEAEEKLMKVLDEAAKSFKRCEKNENKV